MKQGPVVLVGLDAADLRRIERLIECGSVPNFARFLKEGARGRLHSRPTGLSATIWPKWFEGGQVGSWYFPKQWNPDRMCLEWITATRGDPEPFWCDLDRRGLRVCIVDVPQAPLMPLEHGIVIQGWQVHDLFDRWSEPGKLWGELTRKLGAPLLGAENYGPQTPASLLALRSQLLAATEQAGRLAQDLQRRGPFDLFVMVLGALHRGGHYLWDTSQVQLRGEHRENVRHLEGALDEIYVAADRALGMIMNQAPSNARVLLFALHGMQANSGWSERFQAIGTIVADRNNSPARQTVLQRVRRILPARFAQSAVSLLPARFGSRLLELTSSRAHDWACTPWFVLPSDLAGFVRLNVKGREARGIVNPGAESRRLEDGLIELFSHLTDLDGRSIVADVERTDDTVAVSDPMRRYLPDLFINWSAVKAGETAGIRLGGREIMRWLPGEPHDSGRSGNHATEGWYSVIAPGIERGSDMTLRDVDWIVPAIYKWLGEIPPERFNCMPLLSGL
jgi:predicted AlkP superfamily phosphohydrolase/phosphomutase